jgi:hypothetical protein
MSVAVNSLHSIIRNKPIFQAGNKVRDQFYYKEQDQVSDLVRGNLYGRVLVLIKAQLKDDL